MMELLGVDEGAETPALAAAALEFALEGLFLNRRISKDTSEDGDFVVYGGS
jgi:magnesium chelatase subunit I